MLVTLVSNTTNMRSVCDLVLATLVAKSMRSTEVCARAYFFNSMRRLTVDVDGHTSCYFFSSMRRLTVDVDGHASCYLFITMRRLTVDVDGHAPYYFFSRMRRLTVDVDGQAPCYFFSSMRRLTDVVDVQAPCYFFSSMRRFTVVRLSVVVVETVEAYRSTLEDVDGSRSREGRCRLGWRP